MRNNDQRRVERRRSLQSLMPTTPDLPSEGPLSPPPLLLLAKPAIRSRSSLTSLKKMPMIREDEGNPIFINVPNRRPRPPRTGVFYQYGEDYITPWHLVGMSPSPAPRAAAQTAKQGSSVRGGTSEDSSSSSDWEPEERQGVKHGAVVRDGACAVKRGGWRRLRESRYWSWL